MLKPLFMRRRIPARESVVATLPTPAGDYIFTMALCGFSEADSRRMGAYLATHCPELKPKQIGAIVAISLHAITVTDPARKVQRFKTIADRDKLAELLIKIALQRPELLDALHSSLTLGIGS